MIIMNRAYPVIDVFMDGTTSMSATQSSLITQLFIREYSADIVNAVKEMAHKVVQRTASFLFRAKIKLIIVKITLKIPNAIHI